MPDKILTPCEGYVGNPKDLAGDQGNAGKPYSADLKEADGGVIPNKGLAVVKGSDSRGGVLSPRKGD